MMVEKPVQTDDLDLFKALRKRPRIAWPTIILLVAAFSLFTGSTWAYIEGVLPLFAAILINAVAAYMSFTPVHEASHGSVSSNSRLNDWVGRISTVLLAPIPFFRTFRFMHAQHHRFTNDKTKDPDCYTAGGPKWLLPLRWLTLEIGYFSIYLSPEVFWKRPKSERIELYLGILFGAFIIATVIYKGWLANYLLLVILPSRIANFFIAFAFDFLPHYPHEANGKEQPFQATSNRVGMEWLLTPIFLYQNYHLVHHLYPAVPFYRLIKVWNAKKQYHESQKPAIASAFSLGPNRSYD